MAAAYAQTGQAQLFLQRKQGSWRLAERLRGDRLDPGPQTPSSWGPGSSTFQPCPHPCATHTPQAGTLSYPHPTARNLAQQKWKREVHGVPSAAAWPAQIPVNSKRRDSAWWLRLAGTLLITAWQEVPGREWTDSTLSQTQKGLAACPSHRAGAPGFQSGLPAKPATLTFHLQPTVNAVPPPWVKMISNVPMPTFPPPEAVSPRDLAGRV